MLENMMRFVAYWYTAVFEILEPPRQHQYLPSLFIDQYCKFD